MVSSNVVASLKQSQPADKDDDVVYYYFTFANATPNLMRDLVGSLLAQLASKRLPLPVRKLFESRERGRPPTLEGLLKCLLDVIQTRDSIYLVLDAIDECSERTEFYEVLSRIYQWKLKNLHIFATSREERNINERFHHWATTSLLLSKDLILQDVILYINSRMSRDIGLKKWSQDHDLKIQVVKTLSEGANGM